MGFTTTGHSNAGEHFLVFSAALRAREARWAGRQLADPPPSPRCGMTGTSIHPAELLTRLSASCRRQDLPLVINDPATISQVAVPLGVRAPSKHPKPYPQTHNTATIDTTTQPMAA